MKQVAKITMFMGKPCIVEEGQFPTLVSQDPKINGKLVGISGNGVIIGGERDSKGKIVGGELEKQRNIANGYPPSRYSHEIFAHEAGEKDQIKYHKSKTKGQKLNTLLFVNADFGMAFGKPSQETTKVANWMKGKRENLMN